MGILSPKEHIIKSGLEKWNKSNIQLLINQGGAISIDQAVNIFFAAVSRIENFRPKEEYLQKAK